jgi:hypothetical protein
MFDGYRIAFQICPNIYIAGWTGKTWGFYEFSHVADGCGVMLGSASVPPGGLAGTSLGSVVCGSQDSL